MCRKYRKKPSGPGRGGPPGVSARNLLRHPNIPKLANRVGPQACSSRGVGSGLQNFQPVFPTQRRSGTAKCPPAFMITAGGCAPRAGFPARRTKTAVFRRLRHAACLWVCGVEKYSQPVVRGVNFLQRVRRSISSDRGGPSARGFGGFAMSDRRRSRDQGAARNGYRKRTRVRVACGGAIRPRGVGNQSSHGHFGRSVVGSRVFPPVVLRSDRRRQPAGRRLSRGPGLPAAALTAHLHPGAMRPSTPAARIVQATRRDSSIVHRATSAPAPTVGSSRGWRRRTRPDRHMRLRQV